MIELLPLLATIVASPMVPVMVPSERQQTTLSFDVNVSHDGKLLWAGSLSMASRSSASFSQQRNGSATCPGEKGTVVVQYSSAVRIRLSPGDYNDAKSLRVNASWQRPGTLEEGGSRYCEDVGTRTVEIEGSIVIDRTKPIVLTGDAGLRLELKQNSDPVILLHPR